MAEYLNIALPEESLWWHTPNQVGSRNATEARILKGLGVKAGIPDILILWRGALYGIELKAPRGSSSVDQVAIQETMRELGARIAADLSSIEAVEKQLRGWGFPLHATVLNLPTAPYQPRPIAADYADGHN